MKIYTSYFAMMRHFPENIVPIAICAKPPSWYDGAVYKKLAPSYSILMDYKSKPNVDEYTTRFNTEILNKQNVDAVIHDLQSLANGKDVVLLCFEKPSDFCHRQLVAKWLNSHNYYVEEFKR